MNKLLPLFIFTLFVLFACDKKENDICEACDSNKLISFKLIQRNLDTVLFNVSYNDYGKPKYITQSGYVKDPNHWINIYTQESIEFFYVDGEISNTISTFSELRSDTFFIDSPEFISGIRYKSYYKIPNDEVTLVLEIIDSTEIGGVLDYNVDTIFYEYKFFNDELNLYKKRFSTFEGIQSQFFYNMFNNLTYINYTNSGEPWATSREDTQYDHRTNPLQTLNTNIGFDYFTNSNFLSKNNFISGSAVTPSNSAQGLHFNGRYEVLEDCNGNPLGVENIYIDIEKECE